MKPRKEWPADFSMAETGVIESTDRLECPVCESDNLHQTDVAVFSRSWRSGEMKTAVATISDATSGYSYKVGFDVRGAGEPDDFPDTERNGLSIRMWCEGCDSELHFAVWQDQGCTYMGWNKVVTGPVHTGEPA